MWKRREKESSVQTTGRTNKRAVDSYLVLLLWGWRLGVGGWGLGVGGGGGGAGLQAQIKTPALWREPPKVKKINRESTQLKSEGKNLATLCQQQDDK
jgi:hypothetical protein